MTGAFFRRLGFQGLADMVRSTSPGTAPEPRKVVVIGAGIAGLCTAVYARKCGYQVEVIEQHDAPGGLATSWRRGEYTFETCLHWLTGTNPEADDARAMARGVRHRRAHVRPTRTSSSASKASTATRSSSMPNIDRMEAEFLRRSPQDAGEIKHFASALRRFDQVSLARPDPNLGFEQISSAAPSILPDLPLLRALVEIERQGIRRALPGTNSYGISSSTTRFRRSFRARADLHVRLDERA